MAIVSVCRGTKSGGRAYAECLGERLGWPVIGREIIQAAAADLEVSEHDLARQLERAPRLWDRVATARRLYIVALQAALSEHVTDGNLVYHGLAGRVLLRGLPGTLRARLIAPLEARVRVLVETERMDPAEADRHIHRVDAERQRWVRLMYGEDIEDPALYDMVINLGTMSVDAACALTEAALRQPEFAVTGEVRAALANFRLACRVKRALVTEPDTRGFPLEATADGGVIEISGSAPVLSSGETGDRIVQIGRAVPGVKEVRLRLQWFDPYP